MGAIGSIFPGVLFHSILSPTYTIAGFAIPGFTIAGFIAGLSLLNTMGRFNTFRAIAKATGIGILIVYVTDFLFHQEIFSLLFCIILLPILLVIYNAITSHRKYARSA